MTRAALRRTLRPAIRMRGGWMTRFHTFEHFGRERAKFVPCGWHRLWVLGRLPYFTGDELVVRFDRGKTLPPSNQQPLNPLPWGYRLEVLQGDRVRLDSGKPASGMDAPRPFTFGRLSYPGHYTIDYIEIQQDEQSQRVENRTRGVANIRVVSDDWLPMGLLFLVSVIGATMIGNAATWAIEQLLK